MNRDGAATWPASPGQERWAELRYCGVPGPDTADSLRSFRCRRSPNRPAGRQPGFDVEHVEDPADGVVHGVLESEKWW